MLLLSVNPILLHSLSLLLQLLIRLPAILHAYYRLLVLHQWPYILVRLPCYTIGRDHSGGDHEYIHTYILYRW